MKRFLYILSLVLLMTACSDDMTYNNLSPEQRELMGSAVNFEMSKADAFQTRVTYNDNGTFNEGDMMVIYRQYEDNGSFNTTSWQTEVFRNYHYKYTMVPGTEVMLKRDWEVNEGRLKGDYAANGTTGRTLTTAPQTEADSITWENGQTVRFRSWARSNLSGALGSSKAAYYPDFMVSDWVTVSGPTESIPMTLKHLGSRIYFSVRNSGNVLKAVEICTSADDYRRDDNADIIENDNDDKTIVDENNNTISAEEAASRVLAAYNRMALPAGVDIETGLLTAMTQTAYTEASDNDIRRIEEWAYEDGTPKLVFYGTKNTAQVASVVQHPLFASNNTHFALVSIPYDISSEHGGEPITLPPYTRFKITLQDVSQGEQQNESTYHIFSLSDIKNGTAPAYPKGIEMQAGYSYQFSVGYRYNKITIEPGDSFSWELQDAMAGTATDETVTVTSPDTYTWWKDAINAAIEETKSNKNYNPEFHISTVEQFLEFIKLVNGVAGKEQTPIYRLVQEYDVKTNDDGTISKTPSVYGWSTVNDQNNPVFVDRSILEAQGYVFYEHYYPSDANREAYSAEDYLRGPYSFFDENLNRHFKVVLDADLDFKDQKIDAVGKESITYGDQDIPAAFKGVFDGYGDDENDADPTKKKVHTLRNLNVTGNYLFNYVVDAAISNLRIETVHSIGLVNKAEPTMNGLAIAGWGCYISGISVSANNQVAGVNAIANTLTGPSYVVGCIHDGDATGPLVGTASDLRMYGCMRTAANISGAALLGAYADDGNKFFAPQISFAAQLAAKNYSKKPNWGRFMCNYYNKDEHEDCKDAVAVASIADDYSMLEYIRGRQSRILRAYNDNFLNRETPYDLLSQRVLEEFYGLAPWKAMNYAIYKYNKDDKGKEYPCMVHYMVKALGNGYDHTYPQMLDGKPGDEAAAWDVLKQVN